MTHPWCGFLSGHSDLDFRFLPQVRDVFAPFSLSSPLGPSKADLGCWTFPTSPWCPPQSRSLFLPCSGWMNSAAFLSLSSPLHLVCCGALYCIFQFSFDCLHSSHSFSSSVISVWRLLVFSFSLLKFSLCSRTVLLANVGNKRALDQQSKKERNGKSDLRPTEAHHPRDSPSEL